MEAAPGIEPGDYGFAIRCLTTWLCRHLNQHNLHPNIFDIIFSFQRQSTPLWRRCFIRIRFCIHINRVTPHQCFKKFSFLFHRMSLDSDSQKPWVAWVARSVMRFSEIFAKKWQYYRYKSINDNFKCRWIPAKGHRGKKDCYVAWYYGLNDLTAFISWHTNSRRFDPTSETTCTMG